MAKTATQPADGTHIGHARLRAWSGRIGAIALAGAGTAHLTINTIGFASQPGGSWPLFLVFGLGLGALLILLAVVTWRDTTHERGGRLARVVIGLAGLLGWVGIISMLRGTHPELLVSPVGPGLWSLVGGPALVLTALLPVRPRDSVAAGSAGR